FEGQLIPFTEYTETDWDNVMNVNLKSVWLSMKYQVPAMLKSGGGVIINNASRLGLRGMTYGALYSASKHGLIGLTKSVALEQAKTGIRVNCVCPGVIETDMSNRSFGDNMKGQIASKIPMGRIGKSEEVANAVIWLCSDHASFITGHCLSIDGGAIAQ
ncbi:MAG TPA: SDR family oxidoreductase, partial [Allocoleopsis sp.]